MWDKVTTPVFLLWLIPSTVWALVELETLDIGPWNDSYITTTGPATEWKISSAEELQSLFDIDDYQRLQYDSLKSSVIPYTGQWTECLPCLPYYLSDAIQIHIYDTFNPQDFSARLCDPTPPPCPDINELGYWNAAQQVTYPFAVSLPISVENTFNYSYFTFDCSRVVRNAGYQFAILSRDHCYGADTAVSTVLMAEQTTSTDEDAVKVMLFTGCSEASCVQLPNSVCYCTSSNATVQLSAAIDACNATNSINLPENYLETVLNYIELDLSTIWAYNITGNYHFCKNVSGRTNVGQQSCGSSSNSYICIYSGEYDQFSWTEWSSYSSCDQACDGGSQVRKRFTLVPPVTAKGGYSPFVDYSERACNYNISCPWNESDSGLGYYYKWAGCWTGIDQIVEQFEEDELLDGGKNSRLDYVDKCAIAADIGLADAFAIKRRLCYISVNLTSPESYANYTPSYDCNSLGAMTGEGYDVYRLVQAETFSHWSPWSAFSSCTRACDSGGRYRSRSCSNPPISKYTTQACNGSDADNPLCNTDPCPHDFRYEISFCYALQKHLPIVEDPYLDGSEIEYRKKPIEKCALYTYNQGYSVFGLAYEGHCISYERLWCDTKDWIISTECQSGMGLSNSIQMYGIPAAVFSADCNISSTTPTPSTTKSLTTAIGNSQVTPVTTTKLTTHSPPTTVTGSTLVSSETTQGTTLVSSETTQGTTAQPQLTNTSTSVSPKSTKAAEMTSTLSLQDKAAELESMEVIYGDTATEALNELNSAISSTNLNNVLGAADILEVISNKIVLETEDQAIALAEVLSSVVSSLTQDEYIDIWKESQNFTSIMTSTESLSSKSSELISDSFIDTSQERIAMWMKSVAPNTAHTLSEDLQGVEVVLPSSVTASGSGENIAIAVVIYSNISEFIGQPIVENDTVSNPSTANISSTIVSLKLATGNPVGEFSENIQVSIPLHNKYTEDRELTCVFWNDTSSVWSTYGCNTVRDDSNRAVNCQCNHTTSYAILMSFTDTPPSLELTIVTYVGCAISLFFLVTSFVIFVYLDNLRTDRKKIHMNLIVALGLSQLTFLVGVDFTEDTIACKCIAILLHYLFLSTFSWMLCEGLHLYHKIVSVFETEGKLKKALYYVIGWGLPTVVVVISVGINDEGYGSAHHCWLVAENWMRVAFIAPAGAIIIINFCVMAVVIRIVVKSTSAVSIQQQKKVQLVKAGVRSVFILTPLLGINWMFGLFALGDAQMTFEFLFVIINTLQGLLIFIFHCVGNAEVRNAFSRKREITSISLDKSSDGKKSGLGRLNVWLFPAKRSSGWPPGISNKDSVLDSGSKSITNDIDTTSDLVGGLLDGTVGRNLGGLRHMVKTPTSDREGADNYSNADRPTTRHSIPDRQNSTYQGKFSISTASTTLELDDSDYGSKHSDDEEEKGSGMEREVGEGSRNTPSSSKNRANSLTPSNYVKHGWSTSHDLPEIEINPRDQRDEDPIDIEDL